MDSQFWINAWNEGRTNFHQQNYHDKLLEYFPQLLPKPGQKVFVPLSGKTKDLLWLQNLNLNVRGIELYEQAVEAFFTENGLTPVEKKKDSNFTQYSHKNIVISCGDFFKFNEKNVFDFIYDRASLVALPAPMRKEYAKVIADSLKLGGKYLLIAYEYDQTKMDGPPFSVDANEIHALYENQFTIKLMESKQAAKEGARLASLESLKQKVYILEKIRD